VIEFLEHTRTAALRLLITLANRVGRRFVAILKIYSYTYPLSSTFAVVPRVRAAKAAGITKTKELKMKNNKVTFNLSDDGSYFFVRVGNQTGLISTNLVKHQLGIAYTKKDGTHVSEEEILKQKEESQETLALVRQRAELDEKIRDSRKKKVS
jgi:hypothetical protein